MAGALDFGSVLRDTIQGLLIDLPTNIVKSAYSMAEDTFDNMIKPILNIPKQFVDNLKTLDDRIKAIPIAPGFTLGDAYGTVTDPQPGDFNKALESFTGINLNALSEVQISTDFVQERMKEFTESLRRQIQSEIQRCMENYLRGIINKNLDLFNILNLDKLITNNIGNFRIDLRSKIEREIEKLLYDKIKIQQIAQFKQYILQQVRKICPGSQKRMGGISPTLTRRLQTDKSWTMSDGITPARDQGAAPPPKDMIGNVHHIGGGNVDIVAAAGESNSTAELLEGTAENTIDVIKHQSEYQALGYNDESIDSYVSSSGEIFTGPSGNIY